MLLPCVPGASTLGGHDDLVAASIGSSHGVCFGGSVVVAWLWHCAGG